VVDPKLNASDGNPTILADQICSLPNANFDPTHLVIAFEALGLARVTALLGVSVMKLDLREGIMLDAGTRLIHQKLPAIVAPLGDDRATSPDIKALQALIHGGALDDLVCISPEDR
jgi:histidine ammonia-lyase